MSIPANCIDTQGSTIATADNTAYSTVQGTVGTSGDDPTTASKDNSTLQTVDDDSYPSVTKGLKGDRYGGIQSIVKDTAKNRDGSVASSKRLGLSVSWADSLETDQQTSKQSVDSSLVKAVGRGAVQGATSNVDGAEPAGQQPPIALVQPPSKSLLRHSSMNARAVAAQQQQAGYLSQGGAAAATNGTAKAVGGSNDTPQSLFGFFSQQQQQQQQQAGYLEQSGNGAAKAAAGNEEPQSFGMGIKRFFPPLCAVGMPSLITPSDSKLGSPHNAGVFDVNSQGGGSSAHNGPNAGPNSGEIPAGEPNLRCFLFFHSCFSGYRSDSPFDDSSSNPLPSQHLQPELEGDGDRHGAQGTTSTRSCADGNLPVGHDEYLRPRRVCPASVPTAARAIEHAASVPADKS